MTRDSRGFSLVELMVSMTIMVMVGGVAGVVIYSGNRIFTQESSRQTANSQTRIGLAKAVARLRESAARVARVNLSLNKADGTAAVRNGLLVWTDSEHRIIYVDRDEAGSAGATFPDFVGWDDRNADGKADLLGIGLVPEDENRDGVQDFVDINRDGVADNVVRRDGVNDSRPDLKWRLVMKSFGNLTDALDATKWANPEVISRGVVPFITVVNGVDQYDTIQVEGIRPENYDYGHDADWDTVDTWQSDGLVDEFEVGLAVSADSLINAQGEYDLVGPIKFSVTPAVAFEKGRFDADRAFTAVTPRAFAIRDETRMKFPDPPI